MAKFHINPKTGEVGECRATYKNCPFGSVDQHFFTLQSARNFAEIKLNQFEEWMKNDPTPTEDGWYVQHVFNPEDPKTLRHPNGLIQQCPEGTKMIFRNGWIFTKGTGNGWHFTVGEDPNRRLRKQFKNDGLTLVRYVEQLGARLEFGDSVPPIQIRWNDNNKLQF